MTIIVFNDGTPEFLTKVAKLSQKHSIVVVGEQQKSVLVKLGCKIAEKGKTFGESLRNGLRKTTTSTFTFYHLHGNIDDNYFKEAKTLLKVPSVGLVVPGLDVKFGPQAIESQPNVSTRQVVNVAPWCFSGKTEQVRELVSSPVARRFRDAGIVSFVCWQFVKNGKFQIVLLNYVLQLKNQKIDTSSWNEFLLDRDVERLEPILVYVYEKNKEVPEAASKLFDRKIVTKDLTTVKPEGMMFILYEGEDFVNLTQEKIEKLCSNPDPFAVAYYFCGAQVWQNYKVGDIAWRLSAFRGDIPQLSTKLLVNPHMDQALPDDCKRVTNVLISRKLNELPRDFTTIQPLTAPSLTVATIMKNEKARLLPFLSLTLPLADDVLLVDTGSKDKSDVYAQKFGASVLKHPLNDDFASARNVYLKECKTEWLFHLDVDEIIDLKKAVNLVLSSPPGIDGIQLTVLNLMKPQGTYVHQDAIRVIRNPQTWYYFGRIHESLEQCAAEQLKKIVRAQGLRIYHLGYVTSDVQKKLDFYLRLNKLQMKEHPEDCRPYFNIALHILNTEKPTEEQLNEAIHLLEKSVELCPGFALARYELSRCYVQKAIPHIGEVLQNTPLEHPLHEIASDILPVLHDFTKRLVV